jgi:Tol biopolymer transport system component
VALKILPPELVQSEERVRRFVREAKSASSLNHPNIVTIYEIGQDEVRGSEGAAKDSGSSPLHYISMELVSGETLSTKIHHDKTDLRTLLGYLAQAAEGLAKAHAAGIVHRDLKPGNIMVSKDGFAKVLDFGLAKLTEKATADGDATIGGATQGDGTSVGAVVGTVGYMSPEQVRGAAVDHRSDIFSFGCILYEAATRKKPFTADSNVETMHKILHDKPTPVEEINKDVPAEVRRLIRRCLAKSPDQRFQSVKDLAIELREIVDEYDELSASGSSGSGSSALGAPIARRKGLSPAAIVGGAILLAAVLVTVGLLIRRGQDQESATAAPLRVSTVTNQGIARSAALSPDGRYLAYILVADAQNSIRVRQVATGSDVEILPPQTYRIQGLTFAPDGSYLYYQGLDPARAGYQAVFEVPTLGGTPRKRAYDVDSRVAFSPDGKEISFRRGAPHEQKELLVVLNLAKNQERILAKVSNPTRLVQTAWSPDGKKIAVIESRGSAAASATIVTYRVSDGHREEIGKHKWIDAIDLVWLPDGRGIVVCALDLTTVTPQQLWRLDVPSGQVRRLTSDPSQYFDLSVSADGATLAAVRFRAESNLWSASPFGARNLRQLTFGSGDEGAVGNFTSGTDSTIYFDMVKDGARQIWSLGPAGGNPTMLSNDHRYSGIIPTRAGTSLIALQVDEDMMPHVWRLSPSGENEKQLTTGGGEQPIDLSPDGKTLLFERMDKADGLWSVPTAGGEAVRLGANEPGTGTFSPDGKRILHTVVGNVNGQGEFSNQVMNADGSGTTTVSLPTRADDLKWTPDGTAITFTDVTNGFRNVCMLAVDGSKPTEITRFTDGRVVTYAWSPDGKHLLVYRRVGVRGNLWVCAADGSQATPISDFETGEMRTMRWSGDGSRVLFTYGESSQNVVLIKNFR